MLAQWSEVFAPDAVIDASDVGLDAEIGLEEFPRCRLIPAPICIKDSGANQEGNRRPGRTRGLPHKGRHQQHIIRSR
jgi:hypothetical protein